MTVAERERKQKQQKKEESEARKEKEERRREALKLVEETIRSEQRNTQVRSLYTRDLHSFHMLFKTYDFFKFCVRKIIIYLNFLKEV